MCGITGFIDHTKRCVQPQRIVRAMANTLTHRGPDAMGTWCDEDVAAFLGHRRLAVIDVTPGGGQPMVSSCGRWVLAYNGEVYNAAALRRELQASDRRFRGTSDTEVLLEGIAQWGLCETLDRVNGTFAFAFAAWDRSQGMLYLARHRIGIEPMYWGECGGSFIFASEWGGSRPIPLGVRI